MLMVNIAQLLLATVLMVVYSPPLAARRVGSASCRCSSSSASSRASSAGPTPRCASGSATCSAAISEAVVGAATIRAYGVEDRTAERIDDGRRGPPALGGPARRPGRSSRSRPGQLVSGLTTAVVIVVGTLLAVNGQLTLGELLAFLFLVNLFTSPVQQATEILNEMQNAVAGWRRVIGDHRHARRRVRPGRVRRRAAARADHRRVRRRLVRLPRRRHRAPRRRRCGSRRAVPGRDRGGDRLGQVDAGQAAHPADGPDQRARCSSTASTCATSGSPRCATGSCSCRRRASSSTRTLLDNIRFGAPGGDRGRRAAHRSPSSASTRGWPRLPQGLATDVGQRGRVAVGGGAAARGAGPGLPRRPRPARPRRGHVRGRPEHRGAASSGPSTALTRGRTSIAIAHRLSTAAGRRRGDRRRRAVASSSAGRTPSSSRLGGVYSRLHASWVAQQQPV